MKRLATVILALFLVVPLLATVSVKTADYPITLADNGSILVMNSTSGRTFYLPSLASDNVGFRITIIKANSGNVTIQAPLADYIANSSVNSYIRDTTAGETYASITLVLSQTNKWQVEAAHGTWVTDISTNYFGLSSLASPTFASPILTSLASVGDITFTTGLSGGADIACASAAAATAGQTVDVVGQAGGAAATDGVGKNGGVVTITGGAGSAKNGSGATDGDGGDVVLTGGVRGGTTGGTEVQGVVRVGSPTIASTKTVDLLAVAGGIEVDGAARLDNTLTLGGTLLTATAAQINTMPYRLASISVNVGAVAVTPLYTVPAGKTAVITQIIIRDASGTFDQAADPVFDIGWDAVASGVVASATYTIPTGATTYLHPTIVAEATLGAATTVLNFNVTTAATASTTATVDVIGYLY